MWSEGIVLRNESCIVTANVDRIGFGCVALSAHPSQRRALKCLKTAWDCGIRNFDTAPLYGQGYSEAILGRFLRSLSITERLEARITSKFGLGPVGDISLSPRLALPLHFLKKGVHSRLGGSGKRNSAHVTKPATDSTKNSDVRFVSVSDVQMQFEWTMRRLGVDQLSIYLGHELCAEGLNDDVRGFLVRQIHAGYINQLGLGGKMGLLQPREGNEWADLSVFQYAGRNSGVSRFIENEREKLHIHHGVIAGNRDEDVLPSRLLARHLDAFPSVRVLFSSTRPERIRANLIELV